MPVKKSNAILDRVVVHVIMVEAIKGCARCGGDHSYVMFKSFTRKSDKHTHFGICPTTQEPILMQYTTDKPKKKAK
jgi:hypothetical protein